MPLTIVQAGAAGTAYLIPQKFTVRTISGRAVGTTAMFNCMGLVIHSPQYHIGCLAHIEAEATTAAYTTAFQTFVIYMISKIRKYGGTDAGMQAGLFGNLSGSTNQGLTDNLKTSLVAAGIRSTEIADQRNQTGAGPFYNAGVVVRINANFPSIIYAPATGTVNCYSPVMALADDRTSTGIRRKQLQP